MKAGPLSEKYNLIYETCKKDCLKTKKTERTFFEYNDHHDLKMDGRYAIFTHPEFYPEFFRNDKWGIYNELYQNES